jgi:hypothetical protein
MTFNDAVKKAQATGKYIRREGWSSSRASLVWDADLNAWFDAFGRPFIWSNTDMNSRLDCEDWMVVGDPT